MSSTTYSQIGQDREVLEYYHYKRNGYFIEVGAHDGVSYSNTYLLEKNYGWTGICVEPLPDKYALLVKNRPNSMCIDKAAFSQSGLVMDFSVADMFSGLVKYIDCHDEGRCATRIKVTTATLTDILQQCQAPSFIEYLSVDTEGTELEVFKSIDYDKYQFGVIHVEHNGIEPRRTNMRVFLTSKGYQYYRENRWDDEYILPKEKWTQTPVK
jgi:FkbM family methyltransferase|uniref:Methyltransferase FkbM domain-containing protein n=1 Tax=viral metagenome TaxID=1070528 RepID=A0A6C0BK02_9ZZZZ